jgi:hypothetical protein
MFKQKSHISDSSAIRLMGMLLQHAFSIWSKSKPQEAAVLSLKDETLMKGNYQNDAVGSTSIILVNTSGLENARI